jgi:TonB family protein
MRSIPFVIASVMWLAAGLPAAAQEPAETSASTYVEAVPLQRANPDYPSSALNAGREGWVTVSFVISSEGDVLEPMIEQSSGGPQFERAALAAVSRWKYTPASENGVAVDQAMTQTTIRFWLERHTGASRGFVKTYQSLVELIDGQSFPKAAEILAELADNESLNRYETAWFWWAQFVYLSRADPTDEAGMQRALERAIGDKQDRYLSPDQFVAAAERLVVLYARAADIGGAMSMFERLRDSEDARKSAGYESSVANLQASYDQMKELVAGGQILGTWPAAAVVLDR